MARYPKIDQPCPLDGEAQKRIKGDCSRCGKTVHCLDGMSEAERIQFMRAARGPVCVSYRLTAGMGAALALSMVGQAMAAPPTTADQVQTTTGAASVQATPQAIDPPLNFSSAPAADGQQSPVPSTDENQSEKLELIFVGGVSKPDEAEWVDADTSLPELPMQREQPAHD